MSRLTTLIRRWCSPVDTHDGLIVDSTAGLLAAIADPATSKIYLMGGTYTPVDLTISRPLELVNYPGEFPLIAGSGYRVLTVYGSDVTMSGIALDGSNVETEAIKVTLKTGQPRPDRVVLKNLTLKHAPAHGVLITHALGVTVKNCTIDNVGLRSDLGYAVHGIYATDTGRAILRNNYIRSAHGLSIHVYSGDDGQVSIIDGNDAPAIGCYYGTAILQNNIVEQVYLRYEILIAKLYHNHFSGASNVFIHNLNKDARLHIAHNDFFGGTGISAANPYGKQVSAEIDHNVFVSCQPGMGFGFPVNEHDNVQIGLI